jgi:hypothetical protein
LVISKKDLKYKNITPEADNEKLPLSAFFYRKVYQNIEKVDDGQKTIIDLWNGKIEYGRENNLGQPVFPKEQYLKQVMPKQTKNKIMLINFVADAFEEFRIFWLENSGCSDNSNFKELIPTRGWENVNLLYQKHLEKVYSNFYSDFIMATRQEKKITDFRSFIKLFNVYIERMGARIPVTRSKFLSTKFATPHISGLMVEIAKEDHSKDVDKFELYIEDPKFTFFKNAALRYGFFVDRNAPWRLIANINSPALVPFMEKYGITAKDLFTKYYYTAEEHDLRVLKTILFNFYNSYASSYPVFKTMENKLIERKILRAAELEKLTNKFWFEFLLQTKRIEETTKPFEESKFNTILKKTLDKEKYSGYDSALEYINIVTKKDS